MSLGQISRTGAKTPIAGLNGLSGELVPSVSYYQKGTFNLTVQAQTTGQYTVTLPTAMPDTDYVVAMSSSRTDGGTVGSLNYEITSESTFTVTFRNVAAATTQTLTVSWQAFKLMTDESRALDEQAIADNAAAIEALQTSSKVNITVASGVGSVDCYRNGNVITVSYNSGSLSVAAATTLATGLPKPANANAYFSLLNVSGTPAVKCASLDNAGTLKAYTAFTAYTVGCFSYIAAS